MCDVCADLDVNVYLADTWARQYEEKDRRAPGFLQRSVETKELDEVLAAVYYGTQSHAFFAGAGVETYRDLVNRLRDLSRSPVEH